MLQDRTLDKSIPIPLYFQLKTIISEEIKNGSYPVGSLIPTENEISEIFGISRTTVRQAISELVREGHLHRVKSKGTFVTRPKINQEFMNRLQSYNQEFSSTYHTPSTEVLSINIVPMPEEFLESSNGTTCRQAICLYRKRYADNEPVVRVKTYLPYNKCSYILDHDFTKESLYNVLASRADTKICHASRICEARAATKEDAEVLNMRRGQPVHYFETFGYNKHGETIEYSIAHYRGDKSRFHVDIFMDENN